MAVNGFNCAKAPSINYSLTHSLTPHLLCVASGVGINTLRFLAKCRKMRLNQVLSVLYLSTFFIVLLFIRAHFYVLLVFVGMCFAFWLFWLTCQYLPSDWLERLL